MDFQEDELFESSCLDCGNKSQEEFSECPECGSDNVVNETYHEGRECYGCGHIFDMWEDGYTDERDNLFCRDCGTN
jgi:rRNA maturation endonuclease Nob1